MRSVIIWSAILFAGVVAYLAWPFFGLYQIASAIHSGDEQAFLERIDLAALRRSVAEQILNDVKVAGAEISLDDAGRRIAANLLEAKIAGIITPSLIRDLVRRGQIGGEGAGAGGAGTRLVIPENPLRFLQGWHFTSPVTFGVTVGEPNRPDEWTSLTLHRQGLVWQLAGAKLPRAVMARIQPALRIKIGQAG